MKNSHLGVCICSHVRDFERPVRLVIHHEDGDWQFLCGESDHHHDKPTFVGVSHLFQRDESLESIIDLNKGFEAERATVESEWVIRPYVE